MSVSARTAAHSSGQSTATGAATSSGDTATVHERVPLTASSNMQVDSDPNMQTSTAKMSTLSISSHQFVEREMGYRDELNTRLQDSQRYPSVPDIQADEQRDNFPTGTIDSATFAVVQPSDAAPLLRHDLLQPPLEPHAFRSAIAEGLECDPGWLDTTQQASIKDVVDILQSYYRFVARPGLDQLAVSVDAAFNMLQKDVFNLRAELRDLGQEVRQEQTEPSRLCTVVGGWPDNTPPQDRADFIYDQMNQMTALKQLV